MIAVMDSDRNGRAAAEIEQRRVLKAVREVFPNWTEYKREVEAAQNEYWDVSRARDAERKAEREAERQREREAREAATNVCPNCKERFMQGEVYCQTRGCITQLQTKTSPCRGCGKHIPSTVAFCRHCRLRQ